jgi:threonyl-tRNA synthetase
MERMVSYLIELYAGAFPLWLAPVQAILLPITDKHFEYARSVASTLKGHGYRIEVDAASERVGKKVAAAESQKIPYMLIVGDRDAASGNVSVRQRGQVDLGAMPVDDFVRLLDKESA